MARRIDVRTKTMSAEALTCRTWGHSMVPVPVPAATRTEFHALGQRFVRLVCSRGCSRWRECIFDMDTAELIGTKGGYADSDSYLVQATGTGRLPRAVARGAFFKVVGEPKGRAR